MRTVKEVSNLTGISVRTLHYYDEIGLLKPTDKSEAGYRLYDDKALETLQRGCSYCTTWVLHTGPFSGTGYAYPRDSPWRSAPAISSILQTAAACSW